eukprot:Rhum_TRINITY_DN2662_c0_g1::Rhum_TRINITY_DN2662_c0_g1_i1::g.7897::m.7897/K14004/SEC13; protein transport protein SEC13
MAAEVLHTGHTDMIHDVQYDYYGRYLATCGSDGSVRVFEAVPGGEQMTVATLEEHTGPVWNVAWGHPKFGCALASAGYDGKVVVWQEKEKGLFQKVYEYAGHTSSVNAVTWAAHTHGAAMLACCSSDSSISVLTYNPQGTWDVQSIPHAHQIGCNCVAFEPPTPQGKLRIASGGADNLLKIWTKNEATGGFDAETDLIPEGSRTYPEWVRDVAFCPSTPQASTTLLAACSGSKVYIWCRREAGEKSQWSLLAQLATKDTAWKLSWSEHESLLSVSCADNNAYVFKNVNVANPADWKQVQVVPLEQRQ